MHWIKTRLRAALRRQGYDLVRRPPLLNSTESEAQSALARVRANTMLPEDRLLSLYDQAAYCDRAGIPGAFVECGVWKGGAVAMMSLAAPGRTLHLFDSFTDICEPEAIDGPKAIQEAGGVSTGALRPVEGFYASSGGHGTIEECARLLRDIGNPSARFHRGWFQDTVPQSDTGPIAILRLDGDWYASTKVCLDHLFDRVVPGGIVIIDDYGTYEGCRRAVDEFFASRPHLIHMVDAGCGYVVKTDERPAMRAAA